MQTLRHYRNLAEAVRFELTDPCESPDFKSGAIDPSTTLPYLVEYPGIEPGVPEAADLQSTASPLMLLLRILVENGRNRTSCAERPGLQPSLGPT